MGLKIQVSSKSVLHNKDERLNAIFVFQADILGSEFQNVP
jgi:hypothetical protein